ncbi:MAG: hypothetical protein N3D16_08605 [Anaerolineales bacterium]|nr:hypothetical protein [Anaerolineales bacterium]
MAWVILLGIAAVLKTVLLVLDRFPFNADEAIVALMARHILLNGERPIFFYGQAYMGSLDAFLVAGGFALFGFQVWVIRAIQTVLYLLIILSTLALTPLLFSSSHAHGRWYSGLLLAVPTVNVTLYTTVSLGGYGEALLIGNLILYLGLKLLRSMESGVDSPFLWFWGVGFFAGLGLWVNGLTAIYTLPVMIGIIYAWFRAQGIFALREVKEITLVCLLIASGIFVGSAPWWFYASRYGIDSLISELLGSAIATSQSNWLQQIVANCFYLLIFGISVTIGLRPPWEIRWLALPLAPIAIAFWLAVVGLWTRFLLRSKASSALWVLSGVAFTFILAFILTPYGGDPSGRYFLPLWMVLSLIAGEMVARFIPRTHYQIGLIGLVVGFNLWGVIECAMRYPPGLTTQFDPVAAIDHRHMPDLLRFLQESGETRGYSNYWVAYPLAFLSEEKIIYSPRLPYHPDLRYTPRDDRYPLYTEQVAKSEQVAYITTKNPALDQYLTEKFQRAGIEWQEVWIGDYHVFYRLSRAIHPREIGLGDKFP